MLYCAASMRVPVERIIAEYRSEYGVLVQVQYGGSNTLLGQLEVSGAGDLYLAADDSYLQLAREKGLLAETLPLARMQAVVGVRRGNPKGVTGLEDLVRDDLKLVVANPDQAAIGKRVREALHVTGRWQAIADHARGQGVYKPTVNDAANDIQIGSVDAGFLWDAVALQYPDIDLVHLPELATTTAEVGVGVLKSTTQPAAALHFARYLAARDRGLQVLAQEGYEPLDGDPWADQPGLTLYAAAVNQSTLEPIVAAFEQREGVRVNTVYSECGLLASQMSTLDVDQGSDSPDACMACDSYYYRQPVRDLFPTALQVASAPIVIAVAKGNPKAIHALSDLARPGVRIVLGQPDPCSIGGWSRRLLESAGVDASERIVAAPPTAALLVASIAADAADATLVYRADALAERGRLDIIPVDSPLAYAVQSFGIARSSEHQQLSRRLLIAIADSRERFESAGFAWQLDPSLER